MTDPKQIAAGLTEPQRRVILSLSGDWGKAADSRCARRMFWGVRGGHYLVEHKHLTDNCWRLNGLGLQVRALIEQSERRER